MNFIWRRFGLVAAGTIIFLGGIAVGGWQARGVHAQSKTPARKFGQPKTIIHLVVYKWVDGVSEADKQKALDGIKELAARVPGVKNVWLKTHRNQLREYDGVYAIEFASDEAAADYAESPAHEAWSKQWQRVRAASLSFQAANP
jgi:hypothetical protein